MKSFGVRLAVGAVTLLFGAYAAALAQKDRQDRSDSWTAEASDQVDAAEPIPGEAPGSWLDAPAVQAATELAASQSDSNYEATSADASAPAGEQTTDSQDSVQLVQHTEAVEGGGPAMTIQAFAADPPGATQAADPAEMSAPAPNWTMPAAPNNAAGSETDAAMSSMTLPEEAADSQAAPPSAAEAAEGEMPTLQLTNGPDMQFFAEAGGADSSQATATSANQAAPNALRPNGASSNMLRDAPNGVATSNPQYSDPSAGAAQGDNSMAIQSISIPDVDSAPPANQTPAPSTVGTNDPQQNVQSQPAVTGGATLSVPSTYDNPAETVANAPSAASGNPAMAPQGYGAPQGYSGQEAYSAQQGYAAPPLAEAPSYPGAFDDGGQSNRSRQIADTNPAGSASGNMTAEGNLGTAPQPRIATASSVTSSPTLMEDPAAALPIDATATIASPGERRLEGVQTPSVVIQKRAPSEVKVGKPASFVIEVQNVGSVEALDVVVQDRVPAGMRLVDASPTPAQQGNLLVWKLGTMAAGDERTLTLQLVPEQEGELGSVARVSFEAAASVRTIATRPALKVVQRAPETVLIGQQLEIELEVSNPGTGAATGVVLQEDVPEGLDHPKGRQLDNALGTLAPGEIRRQVLRLRAVSPGIVENTIRLTGEDGLTAENTVTVQVVAPDLQVELNGPSRRFLERPATYELNIANQGTADASNVEIAVQLDRGFTFVSTDFEGQYDAARHAVFWSLAQLPAGQSGKVPLTLLPVEEGEQAIVIEASADLGVTAQSERKMTVEGFAELSFEIAGSGGPIETGAETVYQIKVSNTGSKADRNVQVQVQLPQGLELISADQEAGTDGRGLVAFQPKEQLNPGEELTFGLRLRGVSSGTHVVKATVVSDQSSVPVTKEDSTRVYSDR